MSLVWAAAAAMVFALAIFIAAHHPLWPAPIAAGLVAWTLIAYRFPGAWLFVLPAFLPALNFSPWTGWIGIDEFDLLVLASVAGGYARLASAHYNPFGLSLSKPRTHWPTLAVAAVTLLGLQRGIADAGGWSSLAWYQGYADPLNSLRVGKSALQALLLLPLLGVEWRADRARAFRRFALGMVCGAGLLTLAVLWERAAFPGLFNLMAHYRTVGLFWEMHVGGAAIDAYVVLATPFVAWALWAARAKWIWLAAALFALLWAYTVMTTFSRGAYLGVATTLLVLGLQLPMTGGQRWWPAARALAYVLGAALLLGLRWRVRVVRRQRTLAVGMLSLALIFEAVVMLGPDSFMNSRLARSALDYESRTAHWGRGIGLLHGPGDWLFGLGLGRLPAHYERFAPRGEMPGGVAWERGSDGAAFVRIAGPRSRESLGGRLGLTQRVPLLAAYRVSLDLRVEKPTAVFVRVCESHLLYDRACQGAYIKALPQAGASAWRRHQQVLNGPRLDAGRWYAPRQAVLTVSVLNAGGLADIANVMLESPHDAQLLANGDFAAALAHWLPAAQGYFVPWHIDNLYVETLIERGLLGLAFLLGITGTVLWRLLHQADPGDGSAPFIAASLCGVLCLGLMSSVLDMPRVALLFFLLLAMGSNARLRQV